VFEVLHPIATDLNLPYADLQDLFNALENLNHLEIEFGSAEDAFIRVMSALQPDLGKRYNDNKDKILKALARYAQDTPIHISAKAQRLAYYHENIYRDSDIITDVRPIFDSAGGNVLEMIISHSLVVTYSSSNRTERIHLEMDAGDVLKLRKACDRAILKANTLKQALGGTGQKWKIQLLRDGDAT
jgi:hypothetical protein